MSVADCEADAGDWDADSWGKVRLQVTFGVLHLTSAIHVARVPRLVGGTPTPVVQKLNSQVASAMRNAEVIETFGKLGISPLPMAPDEFGRFVRNEIVTYQRVVKQANIPLQ